MAASGLRNIQCLGLDRGYMYNLKKTKKFLKSSAKNNVLF